MAISSVLVCAYPGKRTGTDAVGSKTPPSLAPNDVAAANRLAAQGLVTWINFPTMGTERGGYAIPECTIAAA